jgi:hypothetical protein
VRNDKDQVILAVKQKATPNRGLVYFFDWPTTETANTVFARMDWKDDYVNGKPQPEDSILNLTGQAPGTVRLTVIGRDGKKALREIVVRCQILVFADETVTVQMTSKKAIKRLSE